VTLTAVETFAKRHDDEALPANERYYRDLIPFDLPGQGEQYGFEVDLDDCTGCKACVTACHSLNGLDDDESWRSVGFLQGTGKVAFQQTVTTACHHCVEPACLSGCPVDAYEKDPITGIVAHLDDQCIGCGYCTWTCPYEVPRFNEARGIVRKCDMCRGRLAVGEAPACVQACPNGAIRISIVSKAEAVGRAAMPGATVVAGAPSSALTVPTTVYRSSRPLPEEVRAADHHSLRPSHPHPPLAAMLVLTQLAVGQLAVEVGARLLGSSAFANPTHAVLAALTALVSLATSVLHLGRPRYAFRAVLGVRHSWLSREVLAFGAFGALVAVYAIGVVVTDGAPGPAVVALGVAAALAGAAGIASSVMLYAVTRRAWWSARRTVRTFALSSLLTGGVASLAVAAVLGSAGVVAIRAVALGVVIAAVAKLAHDLSPLRRGRHGIVTDVDRSVLLLRRDLANQTTVRALLGVAGGIALPLVTVVGAGVAPMVTAVVAVAAFVLVVAGELVERHQFFRVAVAPRMPGELP
jgi:Fe-S-cluster-containing dehydrogenase component/DMSO reductase anchor subunit